QGLALAVERMQRRHGGVERKEAVERETRILACRRQGDAAAQPRIVGVAHGRYCGEAIEAAAQHHDQEARVARAGNRRPRHQAPEGEAGGAASEEGAARDGACFAAGHGSYLRWKSGDMINSSRPCSRVSARATAWRVAGPTASP